MQVLNQVGAFTTATQNIINSNFAALAGVQMGQGTAYFLDVVNGRDYYTGTSAQVASGGVGPFQSLQRAYGACTSGMNDCVVVLANGGTSGSIRLTETFTWAKSETHLLGICAPVPMSQRARLAPASGATAFANFFVVSGSGCVFQNLQWFQGFGTGTTSQICVTVSGERNAFLNCHIAGMGDDASAQSTGSRSVKITGGENLFQGGAIGVDTITRTVANASVEFASGTARNVFREVIFPFMTSAATPLGVIVSAAAGSDRFQLFERCCFTNAIGSTSTAMSALSTLAASMGGIHVYQDCTLVGITEYGSDATSLGQIRVMGASGTAASTGIAIQPS